MKKLLHYTANVRNVLKRKENKMVVCSRFLKLRFDGRYLGCRSITLKIPLFIIDINKDVIEINYKDNPFHKLKRVIVKAKRDSKTGKIISACCTVK